jgi:hypothetical protein
LVDFTDPANYQKIVDRYDDMGYGFIINDNKGYRVIEARNDNEKVKFPLVKYIPPNTSEGSAAKLEQTCTAEIEVPLNCTVEVGGVIDNLMQGKGLFYLPCPPLKFQSKSIPPLINIGYPETFADGHSLRITLTVTRNSSNY